MDDRSIENIEKVGEPVRVVVNAPYHAAVASGVAVSLAREAGFDMVPAAEFATCVSELATNLAFHATNGGTITLAVVRSNGKIGVRATAEDAGPGIADVEQAMVDGFTTGGGLGGGLPGARRMVDDFEIASTPGVGTRVTATKWHRPSRRR